MHERRFGKAWVGNIEHVKYSYIKYDLRGTPGSSVGKGAAVLL